jgi:ribulose-bisphosphate carboxylase large chain
MKTPDDEVLDNVQECFKPLGHNETSLPVPAGSQWAGSIAGLHKRLGTIDFGIVPGRECSDTPWAPKGEPPA